MVPVIHNVNVTLFLGTSAVTGVSTQRLASIRREPAVRTYSMINPTKSPAPGAANVREPGLMSQVRRLREVVCACISAFV
jgi:hypothetical protein